MLSSPEIIFKSDNLVNLPKETLIALLKHDELNMEEIDIWTSVIRWAVMQIPELVNEPNGWTFDDVVKVRAVISDVIPHIRFFNVSSEDFSKKIVPYDELLTKTLRHDILHYHMENDYKPTILMLPQRKGQAIIKSNIDSVIINEQHAEWISQKIMESTKLNQENQRTPRTNNGFYKLTLLYRHSKDGKKFRQLCAEKGPTVTVGKVLGTEEILGGYNPLAWRTTLATLTSAIWPPTSESFIFSLDKDKPAKNILSSVVNSPHTIVEDSSSYPWFGYDLYFGGTDGSNPYAQRIYTKEQ